MKIMVVFYHWNHNPAVMPKVKAMEDWARKMAQLWNERFDALEKVLVSEKEKLKGENYEQE